MMTPTFTVLGRRVLGAVFGVMLSLNFVSAQDATLFHRHEGVEASRLLQETLKNESAGVVCWT